MTRNLNAATFATGLSAWLGGVAFCIGSGISAPLWVTGPLTLGSLAAAGLGARAARSTGRRSDDRLGTEGEMSRYGDLYVNSVTGERAVVLRGEADDGGRSAVVHLRVQPGGAVTGAHMHPALQESFRVLSGQLGTRVAGAERTLEAGEKVTVPSGVEHDWWNAGETEASVLIEITPGDPRFVQMIGTQFGLANAGKTDDRARPGLLQGALVSREFDDVMRLSSPPRWVQRIASAALAPIARWRGLRGTYPEYLRAQGSVAPDPEALSAAGLEQRGAAAA